MSLKELIAKDIRGAEEAFGKGNLAVFEETHSADIVSYMPPFPETKGMEAYKQFIIEMRQAFTNIKFDWDETISEGNTIAHRYTLRMKHTGESSLVPVPPTGKEVVVKGCVFLHVKNDKIVEAFQHADWLGMMQQLGVVPPMGQ